MEEISKLSVEQVDGEVLVLQESFVNICIVVICFEMFFRVVDVFF